MAAGLDITFTGIAAFVPSIGNTYRVVFPSVAEAVVVHDRTIPPHSLNITYLVDDDTDANNGPITQTERKPNLKIKQTNGDRYAYLIDAEEMKLEPGTAISGGVAFNDARIISMAEVQPDARFDTNLASGDFHPDGDVIAGLFNLTFGSVAADPAAAAVIEFKPKAGQDLVAGQFAERVRATFDPTTYELKVRPFGGDDNSWKTLLKIDARSRKVSIVVGNFPYDGLVSPDSLRVKRRDLEVIDHHFHLYYNLCVDEMKVHPLPRRVSAKSGDHLSNGINCPPAYFKK